MARAASTSAPEDRAPPSRIVPSNHGLTSAISANGDSEPACPPAPAVTRISPSTPASAALRAWCCVVTSWNTTPPYECTATTTRRPLGA